MGMMGGGQMPHSPMYQLERQLGIKHGPAHEMEKGSMFDEKKPGDPNTPQPGQQTMASVPQQIPQTPIVGSPVASAGAQSVAPTGTSGMGGMNLDPTKQGGMSAGV
jgi:hypothetical protein